MNHPCFKGKPISSISALARTLCVSEQHLVWVAHHANQFYRPLAPKTKPDGTKRQIYDPAKPLKDVQRRINRYIFSRVSFPLYLQGGIRDQRNPRSCKANATIHSGAHLVINEDISGFFPSIKEQQVGKMWQHFFCFPPGISLFLTRLTTHKGHLPQGSPTSSYIANLIFWEHEPAVVQRLAENHFSYSRYIDDVTISSRKHQSNAEKTYSIQSIIRMCKSKGCRINRRKHRIESAGNSMQVNNLVVNSGVSVPKAERARIRAAVQECEKYSAQDRATQEYQKLYKRTRGRVIRLHQYNHQKGHNLLLRLENCRPL